MKLKLKCTVHPITGHKGPEGEQWYSSTLSLPSELNEGEWSMPCPGHFTPGKETHYPLYRGCVGPRVSLDRCRKSRPYQDSIPGMSSQ